MEEEVAPIIRYKNRGVFLIKVNDSPNVFQKSDF